MKKLSKIIVLIFFSFIDFSASVLVLQKNSSDNNTKTTPETQQSASTNENADNAPSSNSKILVAYFSCTGNTENAAQKIATATGGDLYTITPAEPYTADDLRYNDDTTRATKEQHDTSIRPALAGTVDNFQQYDVIFVGYPIWWDQAPRVINTFLESYDFSGKKSNSILHFWR